MNDNDAFEGDAGTAVQAPALAWPAGARPFIAAQCMAAVGSIDATGAVWASLLFGKPGFLRANDDPAIRIEMPAKERDLADPAWENIAPGAELGMLFIDVAARRRCRVNGTVQRLDRRGAEVVVRAAQPGCPRHLARRVPRLLGEPRLPVQTAHGALLRGAVERIVRRADTVFVASRHPVHGVDAAHRGGAPGFVELAGPSTLRIPDYPGNHPSSTLDNFRHDARAGICIPDTEHGQVLQLTGRARIVDGRTWEFEVSRWILRDMPRAVAWDAVDAA